MEDEEPLFPCPCCGGGEINALGVLGDRLHLRCRDCGADFSVVDQTPDPEESCD